MKKICLFLLMFVLFFGLCTCGIFSAEAVQTTSVSTYAGLSNLFSTANSTADDYIVNITGNFKITGQMKLTNAGSTVTLIPSGANRTITASFTSGTNSVTGNPAFYLTAGTLNLGNPNGGSSYTLTLDGGNASARKGALVRVQSDGAVVNMYDGMIIQNNVASGVSVNGGTFNMHGGVIQNCQNASTGTGGGGVVVTVSTPNAGGFNMSGGTIQNCTATYYGGGVGVDYNATFNMTGGTIKDCTAGYYGGGVYIYNRGTSYTPTFNMSGGTITNCSAVYYGGGFASLPGNSMTTNNAVFNMTGAV